MESGEGTKVGPAARRGRAVDRHWPARGSVVRRVVPAVLAGVAQPFKPATVTADLDAGAGATRRARRAVVMGTVTLKGRLALQGEHPERQDTQRPGHEAAQEVASLHRSSSFFRRSDS